MQRALCGTTSKTFESPDSPQPFQDGADNVEVVEDGQEDEEPVEDGVELFGAEYGDGQAVGDEADKADARLEHELKPPADQGVQLDLSLAQLVACRLLLVGGGAAAAAAAACIRMVEEDLFVSAACGRDVAVVGV